jgi:methylated-DNA-protein-cysteine methyltransferase-like protein
VGTNFGFSARAQGRARPAEVAPLARIFTAMKKPAAAPATPITPAPERNYFADVHEVVRLVPPGRVTSYGAIAHYLGAKHGSRAVGYALMAANLDANTLQKDAPVPAHRVVNRLGQLTGRHHFPTPTAMQERLEAEGVRVEEDVVVDFKKLYWDPALELA